MRSPFHRTLLVPVLILAVAACSDSPTEPDPHADGPLRYELCTIPQEADTHFDYQYAGTFYYEDDDPTTRSGGADGSSNPPALACGPARSTAGTHAVGASFEITVNEGAIRAILRQGLEEDFDWDSDSEPSVVAELEGSAGETIVLEHGAIP